MLLSGHVFDTASGLADALRCNGGDVPVVQEAFECWCRYGPVSIT